jgi:hypothetical protein
MAESCSNRSMVNDLHARARNERADDRAALYQEVAGELLYPASRPLHYDGGKSELESMGISGELPIIVARVDSDKCVSAVTELLAMQRYWRTAGIRCDLVFVKDCESEELEKAVVEANNDPDLVRDAESFTFPGYAFTVKADAVNEQLLQALRSNARIEIDCSTFELAEYVSRSRSMQ